MAVTERFKATLLLDGVKVGVGILEVSVEPGTLIEAALLPGAVIARGYGVETPEALALALEQGGVQAAVAPENLISLLGAINPSAINKDC